MMLHFNVTGDRRKELVAAIAKHLGTEAKYLRVPTCAYLIGEYNVSKDGILTFPDETDLSESSAVIDACVMVGFEPEEWENNRSLETEDALDGNELPADGGTAEAAEKTATEAEETATGEDLSLTVEMPRAYFTDDALENLKKLIDAKAPLLKQALGAAELPIIITDEKVSFPWFKEDIDADACAAYTCLITSICRMAKDAKRVTAKEKEVENTKYAFRCFLLRLGFIGDEYKQNRKILMKNLTGSAAFKSGAKKGGEQ